MTSKTSRKRKTKQACGLCGKDPAAGFATINGVRYCHGDDDSEPTCYMRSQGRYTDLLYGLAKADHD